MAEHRKPSYIFLLKKVSKGKVKTNKVEVFPGTLWIEYEQGICRRCIGSTLSYRLRINGKWFPKGKMQFFKKSELKNLIWKAIKLSDENRS